MPPREGGISRCRATELCQVCLLDLEIIVAWKLSIAGQGQRVLG